VKHGSDSRLERIDGLRGRRGSMAGF